MFEAIECPEDIAADLADLGGYNYFGEPLFRLMWAQNETELTVSKCGPWYVEDWNGVRDPVWLLQKWMPPEAYGTPELYNAVMADSIFERVLGGPYPEFGRYETIIKFKSTRFDASENRIVIETLPLNWDTVYALTAVLNAAAEMTKWQIECAKQAEREIREKAKLDKMADALFDALPEFYGPVSYAGQQNKTALIDREVAKIEQQWKQFSPLFRKNMPRGFFQKN